MSLALQENYVDAGGLKTHYWEIGDGFPIIFVHGGGAGADGWGNWHHLMPLFANEGYRAIALDMIGFGSSAAPDPQQYPYSNASRVQHLIHFIEALNLGSVHLVGNSMGGSASLGVAMERPELVNKLILLGSAGRHRPKEEEKSNALKTLQDYEYGWDKMYQIIRSLTNNQFEIRDELVNYRLQFTANPEVMRAYKAIMKWVQENGMYYEDDLLRQIHHPTLLIHGKNDKVVPVADSWEMLHLIESASLCVLPNCGHWVMIEYPEEFAAASFRFFKNK